MKTHKGFILLLVLVTLFASCKQISYKKTKGGMPYRLFPGNGIKPIKVGDFLKLSIVQQINDSVIFTTADKLPVYTRVSENSQPYDISELWTKLKPGDSVVTTQMMDTFINRSPGTISPQFKKGDRVVGHFKILDVFETDSAYRADDAKEKEGKLKSDVAFMDKYITDKKIIAQRTPSGAFVEIKNPGEGNLIDSGKFVRVKYKGISFSGKVFDTNMDSSFGKTEPLGFILDATPMIKGFEECMKFLRKGSVARFYIPSMLGYGADPNSGLIQPFEHIIFDIVVVDVQDHAPPPPVQNTTTQATDTTQKKMPVKKKN